MSEETAAVADATSTGAITTEKRTSRKYVKMNKETGEVTSVKIDGEVANQTTWKAREEAGYVQVSENDFIYYKLTDDAAFSTLVPDAAQRLYVINAGLQYIQNGKISRLMKATNTEKAPLDPKYNGQTIDLASYINEEPQRRTLTDIEKIKRLLDSLGIPEAQQAAALAAMLKEQGASTDEEGDEDEEAQG